jgi:pimeloyl-ACP methyl ester carboxylesterase
MSKEIDRRYKTRISFVDDGKVVAGDLVERLDVGPTLADALLPSPLVRHVIQGKFFQPNTPGMKPIVSPSHYGLPSMQQTDYGNGGDLQLWVSEPTDKTKGYVVYFEGMAGHFGDLGTPGIISEHVKKYPGMETIEGTPEYRNYRIGRIKALQEHGYGVIAVHLPGFGASKGHPSEINYNAAVDNLIDWAHNNDISMQDSVIMGASQGGATATYMAQKLTELGTPPKLLTLVAAPLSSADSVMDVAPLPDVLKKAILRKQRDVIDSPFDVTEYLKGVHKDTKVLVVAGDKDWVVPYHHSEMTADIAARTGHSTRLVLEKGAEHSSISPELIAGEIDTSLQKRYHDEHNPSNKQQDGKPYAFSYTAAVTAAKANVPPKGRY